MVRHRLNAETAVVVGCCKLAKRRNEQEKKSKVTVTLTKRNWNKKKVSNEEEIDHLVAV